MLKMIKYEYKRAIAPLSIVFIIFAFVEVFFLGATALKKDSLAGLAMALLVFGTFASYIFVLLYGIASYNNDLKNKEGYMFFMVPLSYFKLIGAKLISVLLTGCTLVALIFVLAPIDYAFASKQFGFDSIVDVMKSIFEGLGVNTASVIATLIAMIIVFLIQFFMVTSMAYLAISLSRTVLENKKGKSVLSIVFFFLLYGIVEALALGIHTLFATDTSEDVTVLKSLLQQSPIIALYIVVLVVCYTITCKLLDKKISL